MSGTDPRGAAACIHALVVEDEALIALLLEDHLGEMGFTRVVVASNLAAGLREARSGMFHLAVLDVNLNGERSDTIADILIERGVPFMFSTGFGRTGLADRHASCPVVTKPMQFAEFREIASNLLNPGRGD